MKRLCCAMLLLLLAACAAGEPAQKLQPRAAREEGIAQNPEWPADVKTKILRGQVEIGMTDLQLLTAWGASFKNLESRKTADLEETVYSFERILVDHSNAICPPGMWRVRCQKKPGGAARPVVCEIMSY